MGKKVIISGVFVFAVVGALIGAAIIGGSKAKNSGDGGGSEEPDSLSTSMKAITTICAPTDYKEQCTQTLSTIIAANSSAGPKDFFKGSVEATVKQVTGAFNMSQDMEKGTTDKSKLASLSNCKELLQYAIDELQDAIGTVSADDNDGHGPSFSEKTDDIKNWLSAVLSYQDTCVDNIDDPEMKSAMQKGVLNATQLTSNALALVSEISSLLGSFKLHFSSNSRRLMSEKDDGSRQLGSNGYPIWMAAGDRKLLAANGAVKPNAVVAKDGSGQFKSINAALKAMPASYKGRYVIYVKAGIYNEYVEVTKNMVNVLMYGDGARKTIVTGNKSNKGGYKTMNTASFAAIGDGFIAKNMGFQNSAGPEGHQAVAIRVQSDRSAFFNCRFDGYQDTLYAQTHRQFYRNCVVSGTVDFIFGDSAVILQNCRIIVRRPMDNQQNTITAHGRTDKRETTGIVIHNCRIVPEQKLYPVRFKIPTYLGRPWKEYSRTIIMESVMADFIQPSGWMPWDGEFALKTLVYGEYANTGPGARTTGRVKWPGYKVMKNRAEAMQYTVGPFIQGNQWLSATGAPFFLGLRH